MPHHVNLCYEFGPYHLDSGKRVLTRAGDTIPLPYKAIDILILLVVNAGELVPKDELLRKVWPDTFVEENNLTQHIFTLRRALGDERADPRYIETVTRRGYRFVASVAAISPHENGSADLTIGEIRTSVRPVVAVLPFLNTTGDPELEYLAEGVTDNIINNLSRISKLRVMSRSAVFRYRIQDMDPQQAGKDLGASVVLVGKIGSRPSRIAISVELVDATAGWQLWGENFDFETKDLLEIQDVIARQLLSALKLSLTGDEEKNITVRYTESAQAYQAYLEGRYHWSRYTRNGIEKAIGHFRQAIKIDSNYALAYAAIIDCYLRLTTNYLPPEDYVARSVSEAAHLPGEGFHGESELRIKLRFEWDWKGVERELRRANELKTDYPSPHQWYVAYQLSKELYREAFSGKQLNDPLRTCVDTDSLTSQIPSAQLTPTEEVQILCCVARDQIAVGNYDAANLILRRWSAPKTWPKIDTLNPYAAADLLFTLGDLSGCLAGTKKIPHGHTRAASFLCGSLALFEQLGVKSRSAEAQAELARCYYKQGLFDIAREVISEAVTQLSDDQMELKSLVLTLWGVFERDSGRLRDSLTKLREAASFDVAGPLARTRVYCDLATTLKELAVAEGDNKYSDEAKLHFLRALYEGEAVGHHRYVAAIENNMGFLLLSQGSFQESEHHLLRSRRIFSGLLDNVREAQVNETLARLYIETEQYSLAQEAIEMALGTFELTDNEAFLAEALTTAGVVAARQQRYVESRKSFESAYKVAERCHDKEGAGRALLIMFEEIGDRLEQAERMSISEKLKRLFATTQQTALLTRVEECIAEVARDYAS